MPFRQSAEPVLDCSGPVTFEYRAGWFYVFDPSLGFTRRRRADEFVASFQGAARALQHYYGLQTEEAEVIPFPRAS